MPGLPATPWCQERPAVMTEAVVRHSLREEVLAASPDSTEAVYEFWVPRSNERADVAIIGDLIFEGFEIKTERDSLKRLPRQTHAYGRVFDRCTAVVAQRHTGAAIALLPEWWGVTEVSVNGHVAFEEIRPAQPNLDVDPETLVRLLWRSEVHSALVHLGLQPAPSATRATMWNLLLARAEMSELRQIVRRALHQRDGSAARLPSRRFDQAAVDVAN